MLRKKYVYYIGERFLLDFRGNFLKRLCFAFTAKVRDRVSLETFSTLKVERLSSKITVDLLKFLDQTLLQYIKRIVQTMDLIKICVSWQKRKQD